MKIFKLLNVCYSLSIVLLLVNNVYAIGLGDPTGTIETLETGKAATAAVPTVTTGNGLAGVLMQQLGVTQMQAEGGAGHGETVLNFLTSISQYSLPRILCHS